MIRDVPLRSIPIVDPQTSLQEAIQAMEEEPLKTIALVNEQMYMGLFNAEALEPGLIPSGADYALLSVGPYIHPTRVVAEGDSMIDTILASAVRKDQEIIPVLNNRVFRGVVTRADLQNALI